MPSTPRFEASPGWSARTRSVGASFGRSRFPRRGSPASCRRSARPEGDRLAHIHRISRSEAPPALDRRIGATYVCGMEITVRPLRAGDREEWEPLWDGYNRFYERPDFPSEITRVSWQRFLNPD